MTCLDRRRITVARRYGRDTGRGRDSIDHVSHGDADEGNGGDEHERDVTDRNDRHRGVHAAVLPHGATLALLSGIVTGQMSTGDVRDGAKHAAILVSVAYLMVLVV